MTNPHYRHNAQRIGKTLREAGGYHYAVDEIEAFGVRHMERDLEMA